MPVGDGPGDEDGAPEPELGDACAHGGRVRPMVEHRRATRDHEHELRLPPAGMRERLDDAQRVLPRLESADREQERPIRYEAEPRELRRVRRHGPGVKALQVDAVADPGGRSAEIGGEACAPQLAHAEQLGGGLDRAALRRASGGIDEVVEMVDRQGEPFDRAGLDEIARTCAPRPSPAW